MDALYMYMLGGTRCVLHRANPGVSRPTTCGEGTPCPFSLAEFAIFVAGGVWQRQGNATVPPVGILDP